MAPDMELHPTDCGFAKGGEGSIVYVLFILGQIDLLR